MSEHLKIANRRRNVEAAHSETQLLRKISANDSKSQLLKDSQEIGNEFVHILKHISDLETLMISELKKIANRYFANDLERLLNAVVIRDKDHADKQMKIQVELIE